MRSHFRQYHNFKENREYACTWEGNCHQMFSCLGNLSRHLKRHVQTDGVNEIDQSHHGADQMEQEDDQSNAK